MGIESRLAEKEASHGRQEVSRSREQNRSQQEVSARRGDQDWWSKTKSPSSTRRSRLAVRLNVDPRQADQNVRGTVVLPNGTGRPVRVLVLAKGEKEREAREAGADFVGGEDLIKKIQEENWLEFERVIATPDIMGAGRPDRQDSRTARPDAESQGRHRDLRRRQGGERGQGRQGRLSGRQGGRGSRADRQGQLRTRKSWSRTRARCWRRSFAPSPRAPRAITSRASRSPPPWVRACKIDTGEARTLAA